MGPRYADNHRYSVPAPRTGDIGTPPANSATSGDQKPPAAASSMRLTTTTDNVAAAAVAVSDSMRGFVVHFAA